MKKSALIFGLMAVWLGGLAISAHALDLLDDKFNVCGYVQNMSSYRVGGTSQLVGSESRLQLEMEMEFHPDVIVFGIFRALHDAAYDIRSGSSDWEQFAGSRASLGHETKMREIYMDLTVGDWDFRIGKQQIVWGETDGMRLMDIINPLDMRRQYITRDWEDIRRPLVAIKAVYGINPERNSFLELVWIPGDIKKDWIYADGTMDKRYQSPWTLSNPPLLEGLEVDPLIMIPGYVNPKPNPLAARTFLNVPMLREARAITIDDTDDEFAFNVRNSEFGVRLGGEYAGWFGTFNYFQGFADAPVMQYVGGGLEGAGTTIYDPDRPPELPPHLENPIMAGIANKLVDSYLSGELAASLVGTPMEGLAGPLGDPYAYPSLMETGPIELKYRYYREKTVGLTFNKAAGLWVWRGEFACIIDKHFNTIASYPFTPAIWTLDSAFGHRRYGKKDMVVRKTVMNSMIGFDYKRWIKWINPEKMFFISGQFFDIHIFDHDQAICMGPYMQKAHEDSLYLTLLVNTGFDMERIVPEILVVYDITATGWYIKQRVEFKYGDHWRPEIGALVFVGDKYELPFGDFDNKDEIYLRIKYQF